jgi:hypothetical protein
MPRKNKNVNKRGNEVSLMTKHLLGHRLRVPHIPPEFTAVPWYPLTVRIQNPSATVTLLDLRTNIQSQLGFTTNYIVDVRLQYVQLWGALVSPSGSSFLNPVTLSCWDPFSSLGDGRAILEVLTDYPDQVNRASVGYQYSFAQRQVSVRLSTSARLFSCEGVGPGAIMYVRLFWRSPNISIQSSQVEDFERIQSPVPSAPMGWVNYQGPLRQM